MPSKPALVDLLPDEMWTLVFEKLEYFDLRRVEGACKRFQEIMKAPELATTLFRTPPGKPLKPGDELVLHPLLDSIADLVGLYSHNPKVAIVRRWGLDGEAGDKVEKLNALDLKAANEYATMPACTKMTVNMAGYNVANLKCMTGVTAHMVIEASLAFWTAPVDAATQDHIRSLWWGPQDRPVTKLDLQGDHIWFEGFGCNKVHADGSVLLDAVRFAS
ncbi:hypothetical protein JCM10908_007377 [Rhodotorula pacifica]|uniref:uncharacterized protein n=1 Tax=Rhodotorula pacifica TaxID=1495444 RepID=UPI0031765D1A